MFLMFLCQNGRVYVKTRKMNVFAKPMNNVELARTLSWRENALFEEREKNVFLVHLSTCLLVNQPIR